MEPPAKLFSKLSRRVLDKQLFLVKDIDTVIGFSHGSWISGMLFQGRISGIGSVSKPGMDFTGLDRFFRIGSGFYRIRFGFSGRSRIQDRSGFRIGSVLRIGLDGVF
jgi:hypothetical protein